MLRIVFAGTPDLASTILQALIDSKQYDIAAVFTQPDKPSGRGRKLTASPVKQLAVNNKLPVYQPETLKSKDAADLLAMLAPDIMVVVAYGLMLPKNILNIPKYGCINVHMSLLPRWRGASPIQHAILAGDLYTGVTIMQMDVGLDTGDILAVSTFPITSTDTSATLQTKMANIGAKELITVLHDLPCGNIKPNQQENDMATYAHKINKQDAKIDWQQTTKIINCKIRAFNPWPISFIEYQESTIRVWQTIIPINQNNNGALPGTIITADKYGINVATLDGIISLQTIQLPGKKPLPVAEILNAKPSLFTVGIILH